MRSSTESKSSKIAKNPRNLADQFYLADSQTLTGRGLIRESANPPNILRKIVRKKIEGFPFPYLSPFFYIKVFPKNGGLADRRIRPRGWAILPKKGRMRWRIGEFAPCCPVFNVTIVSPILRSCNSRGLDSIMRKRCQGTVKSCSVRVSKRPGFEDFHPKKVAAYLHS